MPGPNRVEKCDPVLILVPLDRSELVQVWRTR